MHDDRGQTQATELPSADGDPAAQEHQLVGVSGAAVGTLEPAPPPQAGAAEAHIPWSFARADAASIDDAASDQQELALSEPPPAPAQQRWAPMFGPVGRHRSGALAACLAAMTLGVSALVAFRRMNSEMEEFDPKIHARPGRSVLAVAIPWLVGLSATLAGAIVVITARLGLQTPLTPHVTVEQGYALLAGLALVPYLALLLPFSAVALVMTAERLRSVEEHAGLTADRQVRAVGSTLVLLVPVIGGLAMIAGQQRRLNAIWDRCMPHGEQAL